jgi:hypothetical protein
MVGNLNTENKNRLVSGSVSTQIFESGIANTKKTEAIPHYIQTNVESIFSSVGVNASIVIGKDRPASSVTGHGGVGDSKCSTIDIVAGRSSLYLVEENQSGQLIYTNPNHKADAARIYISEMTDVDDNFELVDGSVGNSKNKSAIAMKADGIRIIARDGIKLVTKTDFANSKGKEVLQNSGINIIALNDESTLQPMVLGDNLVNCLTDLIKEVDAIQSRLHDFVVEQQKFNDKVATHVHVSNFPGTPTLPAAETMIQNLQLTFKKLINQDMGIYLQKSNFASIKNQYLVNPKSSIKSNYNKVN